MERTEERTEGPCPACGGVCREHPMRDFIIRYGLRRMEVAIERLNVHYEDVHERLEQARSEGRMTGYRHQRYVFSLESSGWMCDSCDWAMLGMPIFPDQIIVAYVENEEPPAQSRGLS